MSKLLRQAGLVIYERSGIIMLHVVDVEYFEHFRQCKFSMLSEFSRILRVELFLRALIFIYNIKQLLYTLRLCQVYSRDHNIFNPNRKYEKHKEKTKHLTNV